MCKSYHAVCLVGHLGHAPTGICFCSTSVAKTRSQDVQNREAVLTDVKPGTFPYPILSPMRNITHALVTSCVILLSACASSRHAPLMEAATAEATIRARLDSTAIGWNRGDLAMYMNMYDPDASQMGANGVEHGRDLIEKGMRAGFWRSGRPVQSLSYEDVEVRPLGEHFALVTGRFVLTGADRPRRTGFFSTVWSDRRGKWRMIHDHSG